MNRARASALAFFLALGASAVSAQIPTSIAEARRLVEQDPEEARRLLLESGLSEEEIRAQLAAAGIPANALDELLAGPSDGNAPLDADALTALRALGIAQTSADGLAFVPIVSGLQIGEEVDSTASEIFGHDLFRRASSLFQPLLFGPAPPDYRLGPGDALVLVITGEVEDVHELVVAREGFVVVPDVGQISVANLSLGELREVVRQRLSRIYSGIQRGTTTFDLTVTRMRTNQIAVTGEVLQPGAYQLASVATVTNALYAAGGPTELGNVRRVRIQRRSGGERMIDLYPFLLDGDLSQDVVLQQGDLVFVPARGRRVQVTGAVTRPLQYELAEGEDLLSALTYAGGFAPQADRRRITIHRVVRPADRGPGLGDRVAIDLGLEIAEGSSPRALGGITVPPVELQDGDSIVVGTVPALADGFYVTISGMVARPDTFPWVEGMTIRDLILLARGPIVGADLRDAEVSRLPDERDQGELADRLVVQLDSSYLTQRAPDGRYVGPPGVTFPPPGTATEFVLEPFDQVMIHRQPDFEMPRSVVITGEVSVPGSYTLNTKSDRVTDLVERAEGLLDTGYPEGARLYRSLDTLGRIDFDLPAALSSRGGGQDLILQPGDSLHIPVYSPTVVVQGALNSPVTVLYRQGEGFDYYIANAGGFRNDADKGRASVRYANGQARTRSKFLFWSSYPEPGPGSVINVPSKRPEDRVDTRGLISDLVAIAGSITTIIIVATRR